MIDCESQPARSAKTDQSLRELLAAILPSNKFYRRKFADVGPSGMLAFSRDGYVSADVDLSQLPFTTKADLVADQTAHPPYGTNLTYPLDCYTRMHQTSGTTGVPLRWLDTAASWERFIGCWLQIYRLIGLRTDDRLFFPFSFGPFLGFWGAFEAGVRVGCFCVSGGGMSSSARLRSIVDHGVTVVACTPTYALRLAEVAQQECIALEQSAVRMLVVAGEPGGQIPATRDRIERAWGARVVDHWGMTEVGALGVECPTRPGGLHLLSDECIAEIVATDGAPVADNQVGELVVTTLGRLGSPLIRYRTGDLVRAVAGDCCGRDWVRLDGGVLGRADEMFFVRGNNVYPSAVEDTLRSIAEIAEFRVTVDERDAMTELMIQIEPTPSAAARSDDLVASTSKALHDRFHFRPTVTAVAPHSFERFEMKSRRWSRR